MRRLLYIDPDEDILIDARHGETFVVKLDTTIENLKVEHASPGQLYMFIFTQDRVGGHTVTWDSSIVNGGPISTTPHSTTIKNFVATKDGILAAQLPGGISE